MKKILLIAVIFSSAISSHSDEFLLFTGNAYTYNDVFKNLSETQYAFKYDDEDNVFYLVTADFITKGWIVLASDHLEVLRASLRKYLEWEKTASEKKVKIEKEIPDSAIGTKVIWKYGDDWYSANTLLLSFSFLSQTESRHQLVIYTNKVKSGSNEYIDYKLDPLYLEKVNVQFLINSVSVEAIDSAIQEHKKKQEVENLFQ